MQPHIAALNPYIEDQLRRDTAALCAAADRMRDAVNLVWLAHNPDCGHCHAYPVPSVDDAEDAQSEAMRTLEIATYRVMKGLKKCKQMV